MCSKIIVKKYKEREKIKKEKKLNKFIILQTYTHTQQ